VASPSGIGSAFVTNDAGFPFPFWFPDDADSKFISPQADYTGDQTDAPGIYTYETTFSLAGLLPTTAVLTIFVAVDNNLNDILINGVSTGLSAAGFAGFSGPLIISSGFLPGMNTLDFVTENFAGDSGNPTGLRVSISGTADSAVPEPLTLGMAGLGLLALSLAASRRRSSPR